MMQQDISMVYLNECIPFPQYFTPSDLKSMVGERYGAPGDLIVLEKAGDEVIVIASEVDAPCVEELRRALLKDKKISVKITEKRELHRLFAKICNFFGILHAR